MHRRIAAEKANLTAIRRRTPNDADVVPIFGRKLSSIGYAFSIVVEITDVSKSLHIALLQLGIAYFQPSQFVVSAIWTPIAEDDGGGHLREASARPKWISLIGNTKRQSWAMKRGTVPL